MDQRPILLIERVDYRRVVPTVRDVLKGRPGAWCLECLVRHTLDRTNDVIRELEYLAAHVVEGRCGMCAEVAAVYFSPGPR